MLQCVHLLLKNHINVIHTYIHTYTGLGKASRLDKESRIGADSGAHQRSGGGC